jgi:hypothetical protein
MRRPTWYLTAETPRLDPLLATGQTNNGNQQATNQQRKIEQKAPYVFPPTMACLL